MRAPHCADHEWKSSPSNVLASLIVVVEIYTTHTCTPTHTYKHIHAYTLQQQLHTQIEYYGLQLLLFRYAACILKLNMHLYTRIYFYIFCISSRVPTD